MRRHSCRLPILLAAVAMVFCGTAIASMPLAQQTTQQDFTRRQIADTTAALTAMREGQTGCHDQWYLYFPGMVDYCLGLHDWQHGSYRNGMQLLHLAAGWGNKGAQYTLGLIYFNGHHVDVDKARGLAWLMLANERHNDPQIERVVRSATDLVSASQLKLARQLLQAMRGRYADRVAAVRAWRHLRNRLKSFNPSMAKSPEAKTTCILESGGVVTWSPDLADDPHALCMPSGPMKQNVAKIADHYFRGLVGTVTVEPLEQVPAPAASSGQ